MERSKPKQSSSSPRRIPPTGTRPRRIPTPQRPQSQLAMSCPQPRYNHCWPWNQHYGKDTWPWSRDNNNANSSPKKRPVRSSSDTAANNRMTCSMYAVEKPSSTRIPYEGGVFGPSSHAAKRDFFVIHPDWVSEEVTFKKLGVNERKSRPIASAPPSFRRCRSAPPPRYRNPITWQ